MIKEKIQCPYCNYEYLIEEIYLPDKFFGKPRDIKRDENGKIISYLNNSINTVESYTCDNCNKTFSVELSVKSKSKQIIFNDTYTVKI